MRSWTLTANEENSNVGNNGVIRHPLVPESDGGGCLPKLRKAAAPAALTLAALGAIAVFVRAVTTPTEEELAFAREQATAPTSTTTTTSTTTLYTGITTTTTDYRIEAERVAKEEGSRFVCGARTTDHEVCRLQFSTFVGVNIGGWLVLEDDIWPEMMREQGVTDEWSLIDKLGGPTNADAIGTMESHWRTFITAEDLDQLQAFGVSHLRIPVGYWLVDYNVSDGFVNRGQLYLIRLLAWLKQRDMKALLVLQNVPGAQTVNASFTGRRTWEPGFFLDHTLYERGKEVIMGLGRLIDKVNKNALTTGVVVGMELLSHPDWQFWPRSPGIRELYETMVPRLRQLLPADEVALVLSFEGPMFSESVSWLADMRNSNPADYTSVFYDVHISHAYGDNDGRGRRWSPEVDSCKTCCRDPLRLRPLAQAAIPAVIGAYSLETGFDGDAESLRVFFRNQLSLWAETPNILGSFFWNHRTLTSKASRTSGGNSTKVIASSLLDLIQPDGPLGSGLFPKSGRWRDRLDAVFGGLCPDEDLSRCPRVELNEDVWQQECQWLPE